MSGAPMKLLLTVKETADAYGYPVSTIYRLVETGGLAAVRESASARIRILRTDMDQWVASHRTPALAEQPAEPRRVTADALPGADRYVS